MNILLSPFPIVPIVVAVIVIAIIVAVVVSIRNAERDDAFRAETARAQRVAEEAKCVTPAAAQPKAKRKTRK